MPSRNPRGQISEEVRGATLLEAIFDRAPIGISITDAEGRFVRVNDRFQAMLGYTEGELYGMTGWDVVHEDDLETNRQLRDELWSGKRESFSWERRYVRKSGEILWVQNTVSLLREAEGTPRYAMALVEDITLRRLANAAIHATAGKLQALTHRLVDVQEAERRDLARELHDRVGQTLTALRINLDMIRTHRSDGGDAFVKARAEDSLGLIESAFKALQNVMYELRPPMMDEHGLVASLRWYARTFAERTRIRVEVRGREDWRCGPEVELALFRIAQEALNNVARHAQARHVVVDLQDVSANVVMTIEDDGVGIDRAADRAQGPGYGLITMRERTDALGGTFEVRSRQGKGTVITVKIARGA
jgi:PAS domain S-box-containing protein